MIRNIHFQKIQNAAYVRIFKRFFAKDWVASQPLQDRGAQTDEIGSESSISATSAWVQVAGLAAEDKITTENLRRLRPVQDIVETVPPGDGVSYADLVRRMGSGFFTDERVARVDNWGNPIRWPGVLLGSPVSFSPTTLRYLATALWLRDNGIVEKGGPIVEIGVGFGGLAAMNSIVSGSQTLPVDLPEVVGFAKRMCGEVGLANCLLSEAPPEGDFTLISNYAFTELSADVQDIYFEKWIRNSRRGLIVSNANIFSRHIGGRDDSDIMELLRSCGHKVRMLKQADLLCASDYRCDVSVFTW